MGSVVEQMLAGWGLNYKQKQNSYKSTHVSKNTLKSEWNIIFNEKYYAVFYCDFISTDIGIFYKR